MKSKKTRTPAAPVLLPGETEIITGFFKKSYLRLIRLLNIVLVIIALFTYDSVSAECYQDKLAAVRLNKAGVDAHIPTIDEYPLFWFAIVCVVIALLGIVFCRLAKKECLTVTNKRVFGRTSFGKQVDLPMDSVSALSKNLFSTISITTASGAVGFLGITDRDNIYDSINRLLIARQDNPAPAPTVPETATHDAESLLKYKELLDMGIISQEEFDAKKKQILGL